MSHADVLLWLILLHCLRCLLRVVYHFHNVHNSRLFYLMSSVYHYSNRHSDYGNWQHKEHDDYDTQESEVGRCTLLFPQFVHLTKKLSCSKTRWQVKKINYSIVSTKYWFCITYCSTNRTTIQLFYVWWIQWSVIGCNLTFTCKKKKTILFTRIDQRGYTNIWFYIKCKDLSSPFLRKFVFLIPMTLAWC